MLVGYQSRPIAARAWSCVGGAALDVRGSKFALADADAARERARIVVDAVVGDLQEVGPAVHKDAAATLRTVGDSQPIDARGVADVVAREWVGRTGGTRVTERVGIAYKESTRSARSRARISYDSSQQRGAGRERASFAAVVPRTRAVEIQTLAQDRNSGAFIGTHQRGLLQEFSQVAVQSGVPADRGLKRQPVNLRNVGCGSEMIPTRLR